MSIRSEDWLDVAACHTATPGGVDTPHVRLSDLQPQQKRELAGFGLAAIASCAFLLTPLMLTANRELPATPLMTQFAATPIVTIPSTMSTATVHPRRATHTRRRLHDTQSSRALSLVRADRDDARGPELLAAQTIGPQDAVTVDASDAEDSDESTSRLKRGVSRVLFGDGRYRVRPFPTPAEQN